MADDDIELLQQLIKHGGTQAFALVPLALQKVILEKQWQGRTDKDGKPFTSFEAFLTHRLWQGLESSIDDLRVYCRKQPEVLRIVFTEMAPERDHRRPTNEEQADKGDNITFSNRGTSATYTLKRLKRDRPDLFQRVLDGAMSVNAAAIEAGFRKKLASIDQVCKLLDKMGEEQQLYVMHKLAKQLRFVAIELPKPEPNKDQLAMFGDVP